MRNLKRALSLALASVMLLGMMVVGTSAASYTDVDENDNVEAIEVLNAVQVMIGRQGNFEPDEAVNRHEMAVIMAKLVLGVDTADNYVGSHPFTDVVPWADKYVAACYENGLVAGTSATTFSGNKPLTAVEAAAMMLRALGYKDLNKGYQGDWRAPITAMANQIRLFSGVASIPSQQLNRNQVARLALNTLKSPVVDLKDGTFTATDGNGQLIISGGNREYIVRSSSEAYAKAINSTERAGTSASQISGYTVELGEHLYNGKLKLNTNAQDAFGRPSNNWQYDGKDIGTYVNYDLRVGEYKTGVTGAAMFELLTYTTINDNALLTYVDGVDSGITKASLVRSNKNDLTGTGNGVLTEVFVDLDHKQVTITSINTYLAKANSDYNKANETLSLKVFASNWSGTTKPVDSKDVPQAADVKKDDYKLVYMSGKDSGATSITQYARFDVVDMFDVEVLTESTITKWSDVTHKDTDPVGTIYKVVDKLTTGGTEYKSNPKAYFNDTNVLDTYNRQVLTDNTYNIYLDRYGNVIGVDLFEGTKNYVFITGYDRGNSNISSRTADAAAIFVDGTMQTIKVNVTDTNKNITSAQTVPAANRDYDAYTAWSNPRALDHNRWYTYTTASDGTYTLQPVKNFFYTSYNNNTTGADTIAAGTAVTLNSANLSLTDSRQTAGYTAKSRIYGNDASVYITVEAGRVANSCGTAGHDTVYDTTPDGIKDAITDVAGVYTGAQNVKIELLPLVKQEINHEKETYITGNASQQDNERNAYVYSISDNNGYIIASIVMGEAQGATTNYVYTLSGVKSEWVEKGSDSRANDSDTYFWEFDAVANGEKTTLTVKSKWANAISPLAPYTVQEVRYDGDYVTKISSVTAGKAVYNNDDTTDKKDVYDVGHVAGTGYSWTNGVDTGYMDVDANSVTADASQTRIDGTIQLVGRTLYAERKLTEGDGDGDRGLALATDAKAVLIQPENGKREVTNCGSVDEAIGRLADRNEAQDGIQFQGRIVAVLDSNGVAKWVVIISDTNLRTGSDPGYTQNASIKLNTTTGVASLSDLSLSTTTQYVEPASTYTMVLDDGYTASKNASSTGGSVRLANADANRWTITAPAKGKALVIDIAEAPDVVTEDITILEANARMLGGKDLTINKAWAPADLGDNALEIPEGSTLTVLAFDTSNNAKDQTITGEGTLKVTGTLKVDTEDVITAKVETRDLIVVYSSTPDTLTLTEDMTVTRNMTITGNTTAKVEIGTGTGTNPATLTVAGTLTKTGSGAHEITINPKSTLTVGDKSNHTTGDVINGVKITNLSSDSLYVYGMLKDVHLVIGASGKGGHTKIVGMTGGTLELVKGDLEFTGALAPQTVTKNASVADNGFTVKVSGNDATVNTVVALAVTGTTDASKLKEEYTADSDAGASDFTKDAPASAPTVADATYAAPGALSVVGEIPAGLQSAGGSAVDLSDPNADATKKAAAVKMDKVAVDTRKDIDSQPYGVYTMSGNTDLVKVWNWVPTTADAAKLNFNSSGLRPGCIGYEYGTGTGRIFFRYDVPSTGRHAVVVKGTDGNPVAAVTLKAGSTGGWIDQRDWSGRGWTKTQNVDGNSTQALAANTKYSYDIVEIADGTLDENLVKQGTVIYTGYFTSLNNLAQKSAAD